jgi:hypothetical protein
MTGGLTGHPFFTQDDRRGCGGGHFLGGGGGDGRRHRRCHRDPGPRAVVHERHRTKPAAGIDLLYPVGPACGASPASWVSDLSAVTVACRRAVSRVSSEACQPRSPRARPCACSSSTSVRTASPCPPWARGSAVPAKLAVPSGAARLAIAPAGSCVSQRPDRDLFPVRWDPVAHGRLSSQLTSGNRIEEGGAEYGHVPRATTTGCQSTPVVLISNATAAPSMLIRS